MITSIRIDDNKKTPFKYIQKIKAFKNGSEFIFKPGVNVIVGKNGSGKSTLLNMISKYMLCEKKMCSELPSEALYFPDIFDDDKVLDGISIKSDYIGKVFHLLQQTEMRKDDILDNINNLSLYMNVASRSSGEKNLHAMNSLFDFVFNQDEYAFPIQKLMEFKKKSNEFWANRIDNLLKYYKDNHVVLMEKDFEYTILMDEPDRNLDIDNIMDLYKVLSFHKPQTQIIAVIHKYDKGMKRIGCILCPMSSIGEMMKYPFDYPHQTKKFLNEIEILVKDGHYQELGENPNMVLAWYLSKRTVDDFKGLVRRVQSGKFKPNKKNRELWDRFIDYFDIKNAKF